MYWTLAIGGSFLPAARPISMPAPDQGYLACSVVAQPRLLMRSLNEVRRACMGDGADVAVDFPATASLFLRGGGAVIQLAMLQTDAIHSVLSAPADPGSAC